MQEAALEGQCRQLKRVASYMAEESEGEFEHEAILL